MAARDLLDSFFTLSDDARHPDCGRRHGHCGLAVTVLHHAHPGTDARGRDPDRLGLCVGSSSACFAGRPRICWTGKAPAGFFNPVPSVVERRRQQPYRFRIEDGFRLDVFQELAHRSPFLCRIQRSSLPLRESQAKTAN